MTALVMRNDSNVFCRLFFLAIVVFGLSGPAVFADAPNILVIYLDDFGWKDTGYMGSDFYETPNIDRLAAKGMIFSDAYSCAANCAPARACLMSGQYTPRHQIYNVGTKPRGKAKTRRLEHIPGVSTLDSGIQTWASLLKRAGYKTATMGKWHLSDDPTSFGFDVNIGGSHSGGPPKGYYPPHPNVPGLENAPKNEYLTDRLSSEATRFIRDNKSNPWCLYLTHFAVHTPIQAKRELLGKYKSKKPGELHSNSKMATMIQSVDDGVGKIMATLNELNLTSKTVVLFYSDNGGYGPATDMAPLKGYKGTYYEGGIRVPFFVNWPGVVNEGQRSNLPITGVDLFPTICEIAGTQPTKSQIMDGLSLVPIFKNPKEQSRFESRSLFWHFPAYLQSYRNVYDEQRDPLFRSRPCSIIRQGDWKLHQYFEDNALELYNLKSDIGETKNLAKSHPAKTSEMLAQLKRWQADVSAPIPKKPNPEFDPKFEAREIKKATR